MGSVGILKRKGKTSVFILCDGVETEYDYSDQVAKFIPSFKEGTEVEFNATSGKISFMKKVYQSYKGSAKPAPSEPEKPVWKPDVPLHPEAVKSLGGVVKIEEPEKKPDLEPVVEKPKNKTPEKKEDPAPEKTKELIKVSPEMVKPTVGNQYITTLGEKDYKIALMSSIKAASSIMGCALTAAPEFLQIDKEKMTLDDLVKEITQRTLRIAEDVDDWMEQRYIVKKK